MIAFSHYSSPNDISGVSTWLESLILDLLKMNVPVSVFLNHFGKDINESALRHTLINAGADVRSIIKPKFTREATKLTLKFLEDVQPKVFLPQCLPPFYYAAQIAGRQRLPWAFTHHSDDSFYWALLRATNPENCGGRVVAVSSEIAERCKAEGLAETPITIPYGVEIAQHRPHFNPERFRLIYCGRVSEEQKRISLVLQTMVLACQRNAAIEAVVIGSGLELEKCRELVNSQNLSNRIHFTGRLTKEEIFIEFSEAHAILLMSDYEGLPLALLEGMSSGLVPICRKIPSGIPEVVTNGVTGFMTSSEPSDAADTICALAANQDLWNSCSNHAAELIRSRFSRSHCHDNWQQLLSLMANCHPTQAISLKNSKITLPPLRPELSTIDLRLSNFHTRALESFRRRFLRIADR